MEIYYPTLDLFSFHQLENNGKKGDRTWASTSTSEINSYWQKLPQNLKEIHPLINFLQPLSANPLEFNDPYNSLNINGLCCRWVLDNAYAFLLNSNIITNQNEPQLSKCWSDLKKRIVRPPVNENTIGQTWLISGLVIEATDQERENLAKKVYQQITEKDWQYQQQGQFLGGTFWEVWRSPVAWAVPEPGSHALIMFFTDKAAMKLAGKFYENWLDLLLARHQICYNYQASQKIDRDFLLIFDQAFANLSIRPEPENKNGNLLSENHLIALADYTKTLYNLTKFKGVIKKSLANYEEYRQKIYQKSQELAGNLGVFITPQQKPMWFTDLSCLGQFSDWVEPQYIQSIDRQYLQFSENLTVLNSLANAVKGIKAQNLAETDRDFYNFLIVAIIGISLTMITALLVTPYVEVLGTFPLVQDYAKYWELSGEELNLVLSINSSIFVGSIASLIVKIYLDLKNWLLNYLGPNKLSKFWHIP